MKPKLLKLYLKDYGPYYGEHTFILSDKSGIISVIGDNGKGKSTLLGAFPFTLYGEGKQDVLSDLINTRALAENPSATAEASLDLQFGEDIYTAARTINTRSQMTSRLSLNGSLLTRKREEVDAKILELLNYNFKDMDYTLYCSQKNAAKFFNLKKNSDKKEFFYDMFNIDSEKILSGIKEKNDKLVRVNDKVQSKFSFVTSLIKTKQDELESLKKYISTYSNAQDTLEKALSDKQEKLGKVESLSKIISSNSENILKKDNLKKEIDKLEISIKDKTEELNSLLEGKGKRGDKLKVCLENISKTPKVKKVKFDFNKLGVADKFISDLKAKISGNESLLKSEESSVISIDKDINDHKLQAAAYEKSVLSGECPVCKTKGVGVDHIKKELDKVKNAVKLKQDELELKVKSKETLSSSITKDKGILVKAEEKYTLLTKEKESYDSAKGDRTKLSKYIKESRYIKKSSSADATLEKNIKDAVKVSEDKLKTLKQEINSIVIADDVEKTKKDIADLNSEISSLDNIINTSKVLAETVTYNKTKIDDLNKEIALFEHKKDRYIKLNKSIEQKISWVKKFRQMCMNTFNDYINISISSVVNITNQFLIETNSGLETNINVEKDFNCSIYKDGYKVPFSLISGGLEILLGICFRLGTWRFIANKKKSTVPFLILDEVFGELSPANAQILFSQITGLKKYFDYIFITSHTDHVWQSDFSLAVGG